MGGSPLNVALELIVMEKKSTTKIQAGHRYGNWTIVGDAERIGGDLRYPCECSCGTRRLVSAITLRNGSSASCGCLRRERLQRVSDSESLPIPPEVQEVFHLISQGCLPPADQFSIGDGSPSWTLPAIAKILGIGRKELIEHLQSAGPRFAHNAGEGGQEYYTAVIQ